MSYCERNVRVQILYHQKLEAMHKTCFLPGESENLLVRQTTMEATAQSYKLLTKRIVKQGREL